MKTDKVYFWDPYLKGIGQIMLQSNALTGLLFLIGILFNAPLMAFAGLLATVIGTLTARLLKYNEDDINAGLYGFNAALVGISLIALFEATLAVWITLVISSALSSVVMNVFIRQKLPAFTFPFILLTWIAIFIFHNLIPTGDAAPQEIIVDIYHEPFSLLGHGLGFGEVIFQGSLVSGVIFFIAVYINSPNAALYGLLGAILGMVVAIVFKDRIEDVKMGMFSFNAVLAAIAMSGPKKKDGLYVVLAVILSGLTEEVMMRLDVPILTFPFVFATWLTLIVKNVLVPKFSKPAAE